MTDLYSPTRNNDEVNDLQSEEPFLDPDSPLLHKEEVTRFNNQSRMANNAWDT